VKKIIFLLIPFVLVTNSLFAQVDVAAGMGINLVYAPSLNDYIDFNWAVEEISSFTTSVEFYGEIDYSITSKFQLGFEYVYVLWSYNSSMLIGNYNLEFAHLKPSLLAYYVISGEGYKFKFGGGLGVRGIQLTESIGTTAAASQKFSVMGYGLLGRIQGHTKLGGNFYANIGGTVRYDAPGDPTSDDDNPLYNPATKEAVNLNSFSMSIDLGVSYFF